MMHDFQPEKERRAAAAARGEEPMPLAFAKLWSHGVGCMCDHGHIVFKNPSASAVLSHLSSKNP
jgi:hypothetical protein